MIRIRNIAIICFTVMLSIILCGCEAGTEVEKIEITSYPYKIVYVKDVDTKILTDGIIIKITSRDGQTVEYQY